MLCLPTLLPGSRFPLRLASCKVPPAAALSPSFCRENDDIKRLRRGLDHLFCFDAFDLEAAVAPAALLCAGTAVHRADAAFEGAPQVGVVWWGGCVLRAGGAAQGPFPHMPRGDVTMRPCLSPR